GAGARSSAARWSGSGRRSSPRRTCSKPGGGSTSRSRRRGESVNEKLRIGVLALQGDFALHARALARCGSASRDRSTGEASPSSIGVEAVEIRKPDALEDVAGLIIPGGESTTLLKLMGEWKFVPAIEKFHAAGKPIFGTCAGLIVLAREVENPRQFSLGLIDVSVERNA